LFLNSLQDTSFHERRHPDRSYPSSEATDLVPTDYLALSKSAEYHIIQYC
jgi:hypothetical protein